LPSPTWRSWPRGPRLDEQAALGVFYIRPDLWANDLHVAGDTTLDGVSVAHLTGGIDASRVLLDASMFTRFLTALQVTQPAGLPQAIGPAARAALARSVTSATGDLSIGSSDHVLREAKMQIAMAMTPADRKLVRRDQHHSDHPTGLRPAAVGAGFEVSPSVEVSYNGYALKQSFVRSTITAQLAQANAALADRLDQVASGYIQKIADGGTITALGLSYDLLGIKRTLTAADQALGDSPGRSGPRRCSRSCSPFPWPSSPSCRAGRWPRPSTTGSA
jgi:hypothetical protein